MQRELSHYLLHAVQELPQGAILLCLANKEHPKLDSHCPRLVARGSIVHGLPLCQPGACHLGPPNGTRINAIRGPRIAFHKAVSRIAKQLCKHIVPDLDVATHIVCNILGNVL
jgi:hypothetical protein